MNLFVGCGRLTRDAEIKYSQGDKPMAIARYSLAIDRRFREGADFINCKAFGKTAEFLEKFGKKGVKFIITGRLEQNNYTDKDGNKRTSYEVIADQMEFAESKSASSGHSGNYSQAPAESTGDGFTNIPDSIDDEGLPFN